VLLIIATILGCLDERPPAPSHTDLPNGDEILVIVIAASWCHGIEEPGFREALASLQRELPREAERQGLEVDFVGVALDWNTDDGVRLLRTLARFDEMVVGRNWVNMAMIEYVWREQKGSPAVPQIVLVRRHVTSGLSVITVGPDQLLGRFLGAKEIETWSKQSSHF